MLEIFYLEGQAIKKAEPQELLKIRRKKLWINAIAITPEEAELLKAAFDLHPLTIEDLQHTLTRVKAEVFPKYLFCVFYTIRRMAHPELQEIDFILGNNFIITNHQQELGSTEELKTNSKKLFSLLSRGADFVFYHIMDKETDQFFSIIDYLEEEIEKIDTLTKRPKPGLSLRIIDIKRSISDMRKTVAAHREKITSLARGERRFISKKARPYFRDLLDHSIRIADEMEYYREAINGTSEAYRSSVSLPMSEVMKVLSVITTLAMPITVISSLYGTNFEILPGAGSTYGFWIMIIIIMLLMLGLIYFFKRRRWF